MSDGLLVPDDWRPVECGCGNRFHVPPTLAGGVTNCPACRALVTVRGGASLDGALVALGYGVALAALAALVGFVAAHAGAWPAAIAALVGLGLIGLSALLL